MSNVIHVVLVEWRDDVSADAQERVREAARAMVGRIPGILRLDEGPSVSPEGLEQGFEWGLVITFDSEEARDGYLPHPVHRVLAEQIGAGAERVVVFDLPSAG
ncbi:Dabb family protein [Naasia sp. SYSU D00948]|uniref:Dabb family protein n=1 Tax=Naasia sp. SYSU D00948 TaxID=2817379 RepID=UPI001B30BBFA|nr:Dabb family protein [Naasia sp. SYSU D00948]